MTLQSVVIITEKYNGNSKFDFWRNLKVGEKLTVRLPVANVGQRPSGGTYAPTVNIYSESGKFSCSLNQLDGYLSKIKYEY